MLIFVNFYKNKTKHSGEWVYERPDEWDQVSYTQADYSANSKLEPNSQELAELIQKETENTTRMESLLNELRNVIISAKSHQSFTGDSAVQAEVADIAIAVAYTIDDFMNLDPAQAVFLEEKSSELEQLKSTLKEQEELRQRRESMSHDIERRATASSNTQSRRTTALSTNDTARDYHMWNLLVKGSALVKILGSGQGVYKHRSGQEFTFDEKHGGAFISKLEQSMGMDSKEKKDSSLTSSVGGCEYELL